MSGFLSRMFGKADPAGGGNEPPMAEPELSFARADNELSMKTDFHRQTWGMGDGGDWAADLDAGTITFTNARGWLIVAPVQIVGTYNGDDGTWLWGWDHPSVKADLARDADAVRAFGERHGLESLTTRKIAVSEKDCWTFTALACHLAGAQGGYRGPAGATLVFMTFGEVKISQPGTG